MRDSWLRAWRHSVPEPWRSAAFDPTVADLHRDWLTRRSRAASPTGGLLDAARLAVSIAAAALECRRLATRDRIRRVAHSPLQEGRTLMIGSMFGRACRVFVRQPGAAAVVVLTLAIGIGANLSVFNVVNQFLLAPIRAADPSTMVRVVPVTPGRDSDVVSYPNYRDIAGASSGLDLAAHAQPTARVGPPEAGDLRTVELVTGNYFPLLRLVPLRGRLLEEDDTRAEGSRAVTVLSAGYWRSRYGASASAIGQTVLINSTPFEIVGVAPDGYQGTYNARVVDLWAPITMQSEVRPRGQTLQNRGWGWLSMVGRLRPGASLASVQRELDVKAAELARQSPPNPESTVGPTRFVVRPASPLSDDDRATFGPAVTAAFAFTVLLLLVTCANLAGVMQARVVAHRRDIAIRRSLGAAPGRLSAEWLLEALVLSVAGGAAGLVVSRLVGAWMTSIRLPVELVGDLAMTADLDWRVVSYAIGLSVAMGLLFGVIPAWRAARAPMALLKDEGGPVSSGRSGTRLRRALVVVQVALSVVLLVASGLLATSLGNHRAFDPGFETGHIALLTFDLRRQGVARADWPAVTNLIVERLRQQPGVVHADIATTVPLAPGEDRIGFQIPGYVAPNGKRNVSIEIANVGPRYFDALGVAFARGGPWTPGGAPAVVVNETMAARFWPGADAVGKPIKIIGGPDVIVAGVVRDTTYHEAGEAPMPFVFLPADALPPGSFMAVARTSADPAPMLRPLAHAVTSMDSRLAPSQLLTFEEGRAAVLFPIRMLSGAAVAFGAIAVFLTAIGLYGVVSTMVGQRTREIGLRMALGARSVTVLGGVLRDALAVALIGAAAGLAGGYWGAGQLRSWLFGVRQFDAGVYLGVAVATIAMALIAAAVPARRASRVDPVAALRG